MKYTFTETVEAILYDGSDYSVKQIDEFCFKRGYKISVDSQYGTLAIGEFLFNKNNYVIFDADSSKVIGYCEKEEFEERIKKQGLKSCAETKYDKMKRYCLELEQIFDNLSFIKSENARIMTSMDVFDKIAKEL